MTNNNVNIRVHRGLVDVFARGVDKVHNHMRRHTMTGKKTGVHDKTHECMAIKPACRVHAHGMMHILWQFNNVSPLGPLKAPPRGRPTVHKGEKKKLKGLWV